MLVLVLVLVLGGRGVPAWRPSSPSSLLRVDVHAEADARRGRARRPSACTLSPAARDGGRREPAFSTSIWRSRPRRRNSVAGPSTRHRGPRLPAAGASLRSSSARSAWAAASAAGRLRARADDPDQVREGRVAERAAALELARQEAVAVVARRRARSRAPRGSRSAPARARRPPRPARPASWAISAKVRSSARKSGKRRVASASSTSASSTSGKSWPLATIWVPIRTPARGRLEARARIAPAPASVACAAPARTASASRRKTGKSPSSKTVGEVVGEPLGPGAVPRHGARGAVRAARRNRLAVSAVVAGEQPLGAVQDERDVAFRAAPGGPAGAAGEEVRPAPAVEQHDRLAAALADLGERLHASRGAGCPAARACRAPRRAAAGARPRAAPGARPAAAGRSPGAAWRCRAAARRRPAGRAPRPPRGRRSGGRPRACRRPRAPRRSRSARAARRGRTRPSGARRRSRASPSRSRRHSA